MKKSNLVWIMSLALIVNFFANSVFAASKLMEAKVKSKRLAQGTHLTLQLIEPVSTSNAIVGDNFDSILIKDISVEDNILLPTGTMVRGYVAKVIQKGRLSKAGVLYVNFDHVVTTEGRQLPIKAALCNVENLTLDGGVIAGGNYGWALKNNVNTSVKIIKTTTNWGHDVGTKFANEYPKYITTPVAAVAGTFAGGVYLVGDSVIDLIRKGGDVTLNQESYFDIMLLKDLDIPVN